MFPLVTWYGVLPIFQAGHEGSIPFASSNPKAQVRVMVNFLSSSQDALRRRLTASECIGEAVGVVGMRGGLAPMRRTGRCRTPGEPIL